MRLSGAVFTVGPLVANMVIPLVFTVLTIEDDSKHVALEMLKGRSAGMRTKHFDHSFKFLWDFGHYRHCDPPALKRHPMTAILRALQAIFALALNISPHASRATLPERGNLLCKTLV